MYKGNSEYFALKRKLTDECKSKLVNLPLNEPVFVYEWVDDGTFIKGYGCDAYGSACLLSPNITPGLYCAIAREKIVLFREMCALYGYEVAICNLEYYANTFSIYDSFFNNVPDKCVIVKVETHTMPETMKLFYKFKKTTWIGLGHYYDATKVVLFELLVRGGNPNVVPKTTMVWFDSNLQIVDLPVPEVPIITFDIETVSSDPHRVPTGDHVDDILFSVSVHHVNANKLYSLIFLPYKASELQMKQDILDDGYDVVPDKSVDDTKCENILECFKSEKDLLNRTMELLTLPQLHIIMGYNSINYDIKYLLTRCVFYNIHVDKFIWREGYAFGLNQIHIDLFRIIHIRYNMKSYTLNEVSKQILRNSKTGVSAVALRYTFYRILKYNRYFTKEESSVEIPSIKDTIEYNNADTLLVSKLESVTKSIKFIIEYCQARQIPLSFITTSYKKMQYNLWNELFVVGLGMGLFLGTFKTPDHEIPCPYPTDFSRKDKVIVTIDVANGLTNNDTQTKFRYEEDKIKFPGGANFCLGEFDVENVAMYDYVVAYPKLMENKNISDETVGVLPANLLLALYDTIKNKSEYTLYDYMAHHGKTKTETLVLYYKYIYENMYCGDTFDFTREELAKRQRSLVIIIWKGKRGILSKIIAHFNRTRAHTKNLKKTAQGALDLVESAIAQRQEEMQMILEMQEEMQIDHQESNQQDDDDDFDFGATCLNGDEAENGGEEDDVDLDFGASPLNNDECENEDLLNNGGCENEDDLDFGGSPLNNGGCENENAESDFGGCAETAKTKETNENNEEDDDEFNFGGFEDENGAENNNNEDDDFDFGGSEDADENAQQSQTDDNLDFGGEDVAETELEVANKRAKIENENTNPFGFQFVNEFISVYENKSCVIHEDALAKCKDPIATLTTLRDSILLEIANLQNWYELLKRTISSIYGCIGTMIPIIAAVITSMTRQALLQSAQYCVKEGYKVYYIDTDSIMTDYKNIDLSPELNTKIPYMEMEMKLAPLCQFVQRKIMYKYGEDGVKYGQHVNGPQAWKDFIHHFINLTNISTNEDIYAAFYNFFDKTYGEMKEKFEPERVCQTITVRSNYKTQTTAAKFKDYLSENYPAMAGAYKHQIFYYIEASVLTPSLRPIVELREAADLKHVNLFKFYQNMYKTVFNIIKFTIRKNNAPFNIALNSKQVLLLMIKGFLDAYDKHFETVPTHNVEEKDLDQPNAITETDEYGQIVSSTLED